MPDKTTQFNRRIDAHTIDRLRSEESSVLKMYRLLEATRKELYNKLVLFEEKWGDSTRHTPTYLVATIQDLGAVMARFRGEAVGQVKESILSGFAAGQEQTFNELSIFHDLGIFKPSAPIGTVLNLIESRSEVLTTLTSKLTNVILNDVKNTVANNLSDAAAMEKAGRAAEEVKATVGRGILSGEGTASIAKRLMNPVDGAFPKLANNTAMRTVRISVNDAYNEGHAESIRQSAAIVPELQECWVCALMGSTHICLGLHGQIVNIGEDFKGGGFIGPRPPAIQSNSKGPKMSPSYHLCRSRLVPYNAKWPANPKLEPLTDEEKKHFTEGGKLTEKFIPKAANKPPASGVAEAKAQLEERAKQLEEKLKARKEAEAAIKPFEPTGEPISQFTDNRIEGKATAASVDKAINATAKVHGVKHATPVTFQGEPDSLAEAHFSSRNGKPNIAVATDTKHTAFMVSHEMGHWLDKFSLGDGKTFASKADDPHMLAVMDAIENSANIKTLKRVRNEPTMRIDYGYGPEDIKTDKAHFDYLTQKQEMWARAYSQYVAVKSADPEMLAGLNDRLDKSQHFDSVTQWEPDDFEPISKAIDSLMVAKGWIK